ncbi:arginase family protein [Reinekea sp.]|uniref:arginase family protein n=1 Tax=Reinekea sp. TaxID=1970455 RepID=UPI0039C06D40
MTGVNLIGCDLVEVTAPYDHDEITALAAATVATNMICLLAEVLKQPEAQAGCLERGSCAIKKGPLGALFLLTLPY